VVSTLAVSPAVTRLPLVISPAGAAVDRGGHFGEVEVKLRGIHRRLRGANIGLGLNRG
jgi:hypothetical protein